MRAAQLISYAVPPLKLSDNGDKALSWMSDFHVRHLPIVEEGQLVGIVSEDDLLNMLDPEQSLGESELEYRLQSVHANQHFYDVMKIIVDTSLSVVPVIDEEKKYLGIITLEELIKHLADTGAVTQPGGIIILEIPPRDYSLAEIARLVESENALILSSFISSPYGKEILELTLKLNKQDLKHVVATLERFKYVVKDAFFESDYLDSLQDRYDALMRYLNI